jgi:hypothetical protein
MGACHVVHPCDLRPKKDRKAEFPRTCKSMASFQFTVFPVENGYRVRVVHGDNKYQWPGVYSTLEQAGEEILRALKTASLSRGEKSKDWQTSA